MCKTDSLREEFKKIIKNYPNNNNPCCEPCPDQYVATIEISNEKIEYIEDYILAEDREEKSKIIEEKKYPVIALVLESPHKHEYKKENNSYQAVGPATGTTGKNIQKYLLGNIAKYIKINDMLNAGAYYKSSYTITEGKYALLIINAVQYQCSLGNLSGTTMKKRRDKIFMEFFDLENGGSKNFVERLKSYNPRIVINGCTGGEKPDDNNLKNKVQDCINSNFAGVLRLKSSHPASAFFCHGFEDA